MIFDISCESPVRTPARRADDSATLSNAAGWLSDTGAFFSRATYFGYLSNLNDTQATGLMLSVSQGHMHIVYR